MENVELLLKESKRVLCLIAKSKLFLVVIYLAYILFFALVYLVFLSKDHFYFGNVRYEPSYEQAKNRIEEGIKQSLLSMSHDNDILNYFNTHDLPYEYTSMEMFVSVSKDNNNQLSILVDLFFDSEPSKNHINACGDGSLSFDCALYLEQNEPNFLDQILIVPFYCNRHDISGFAEAIYCDIKDNVGDFKYPSKTLAREISPYGYLERETSQNIEYFLKAETQLQEGAFLRFLYFSAVTATTLGYGDIAPITDVARIVIIIQTIFGLILMGWIIQKLTS